MKFLDRWLKGVKNGIEDEPPVTVYWDVQQPGGDPKKSSAGWATHHKTWPDPAVERIPYYLTADAKLSPDRPDAKPDDGARPYVYPAGVELVGNNQAMAIQPFSVGILNYRTAPATSDMTLLGNPEVTLYLSIDRGDDTDIGLTLKDVDPEGNVLYLQSGVRRASFREIDQALSHGDEVVPTFRKSEKLEPGKIYEIRMSLHGSVAHVVRQGHSLELTVSAPMGLIQRNLNVGAIPAGAVSINRIYHSERYPSKILLPVIPGAIAKSPAPECGTLRNQACRKEKSFNPGGLLPIQ